MHVRVWPWTTALPRRPSVTVWRSVRTSPPPLLSRLWWPDAGGGEEGRLGQSNAATWTKVTESPWSSVGLFIYSLLCQSSSTGISIIGNFTIFHDCSPEVNLQKIPRSMYNTHLWLSRQFYGDKSAYYIRSFAVFSFSLQLKMLITAFKNHYIVVLWVRMHA